MTEKEPKEQKQQNQEKEPKEQKQEKEPKEQKQEKQQNQEKEPKEQKQEKQQNQEKEPKEQKQEKQQKQEKEPKEQKEIKQQKQEKQQNQEKEQKSKHYKKEVEEDSLLRIASTDIPGRLTIYSGLTRIKGISWAFSNAICKTLGIDKNRKIHTLKEEEIKKILEFAKNPNLPQWLLNRRRDIETGTDKHFISIDLDLTKEFDIRRMKKTKSYKGVRHAAGLPVRGQRTRAHFRKGRAVGVSRAKVKPGKSK